MAAPGIRRVNVSLDTLDRSIFARVTRADRLREDAEASLPRNGLKVKINTMALSRDNVAEIPDIIQWAHSGGMDITLIETMPLGAVDEDRTDQFLSLTQVRQELESFWTLRDLPEATEGRRGMFGCRKPAGKLGFITPMTHNFCDTCQRVRLTCTGALYMCLGQDDCVDLREAMRSDRSDTALNAAIDTAVAHKPSP